MQCSVCYDLVLAPMILLRSVRAQASGSLVGANLAPVSHTREEDGSARRSWGGGRLDRYVCRSGPESDGDGIYGDQVYMFNKEEPMKRR